MAIIVNIHQRANVETWSVCSLLFAYSSKTKQYYFTSQPCLITFHLSTIRHYLLLHFFSTSSLSHMRHYLGFHFISQQCINLITTVVCSYLSHPTLLTRSLITLASIASLSHYLLPSSIDHVLSSHAPLLYLRPTSAPLLQNKRPLSHAPTAFKQLLGVLLLFCIWYPSTSSYFQHPLDTLR